MVAWDVGVIVFLVSAALLFTSESAAQMPEHAAQQQEGEWTIFFLTLAATVVSFVAIFGVFANSKDLSPGLKSAPHHCRGGHALCVVADDPRDLRVSLRP